MQQLRAPRRLRETWLHRGKMIVLGRSGGEGITGEREMEEATSTTMVAHLQRVLYSPFDRQDDVSV